MKWLVEFLNDKVEKEFAGLPVALQAAMARVFDLVEKYGLENIGMPHVRHLQGKLWEVRGKGKDGIARSIYVTALGCRVIILRSFVKKSQKTPSEEIDIALSRAKELE